MPEIQEVPPKHIQIANHIRDRILRGDLRAGQKVPSKRQLAAEWGVAAPTAEKALLRLRRDGFTESRSGSGTYVRDRETARRARERYGRARETGKIYADNEYARILVAEQVKAPAHVTEALGLPSPATAIRRQRVIMRDEQPVEVSTSWFDGALAERAPLLLVAERILQGTPNYVEERTGVVRVAARDRMSARLATEHEAALLNLAPTSPVLAVEHIVLSADDTPVEFTESVYPPGRWTHGEEYQLA